MVFDISDVEEDQVRGSVSHGVLTMGTTSRVVTIVCIATPTGPNLSSENRAYFLEGWQDRLWKDTMGPHGYSTSGPKVWLTATHLVLAQPRVCRASLQANIDSVRYSEANFDRHNGSSNGRQPECR
ncbi:hypothetical protein SARC_07935 [Sphaeroforma arctica JP610]|uniref:Uncharacterized protein n=1 Tax=Sphaeroforma arctica JP610 TaxID=667725 RepID=A0A0L0FSX5_9EUKA|nr:hypothetical protein SARC_07935 [Sphaeroforma arctica JP610]KNC79671.1 hypothetical protein SARC_07935 [Sphaeroforma arctica JP610]|eukprot:XP_014153573.1 hypothetical protein SARC_07935 [Sphaeroforma arctica JP610]